MHIGFGFEFKFGKKHISYQIGILYSSNLNSTRVYNSGDYCLIFFLQGWGSSPFRFKMDPKCPCCVCSSILRRDTLNEDPIEAGLRIRRLEVEMVLNLLRKLKGGVACSKGHHF